MDYASESLKRHYDWKGKIEVVCRCPLEDKDDLSLAYTPGVHRTGGRNAGYGRKMCTF